MNMKPILEIRRPLVVIPIANNRIELISEEPGIRLDVYSGLGPTQGMTIVQYNNQHPSIAHPMHVIEIHGDGTIWVDKKQVI
jgi:hypothetical protein